MKWNLMPVTQFCDSVRDGTHETPKPIEKGYKLVTGKHIKGGQIDSSDAYFISEEEYRKINSRSLVEQWDVLMSMIGTVGEVAVVKDIPNYAIKNVALFKCGGSELKGKWLAYYLQSPMARGKMAGEKKGSSQQFLSLKQLRALEIPVPEMQQHMKFIVNVLSAYDDLIENNQKQIRLLEEAAERLYREWFVALRFPGHETTPVTDGVPEGWEKGILGDIARFKRGKTITKAETRKGNVPVVAGGLAPAYYHDKANTVAPVVTVSGSGANAGFARLYNVDVFASDCSFVDIQTTPYLYFVCCFIKDNKESFEAMQKGAAQPHVYAKDINALELYIPPKSIMIDFCKFVSVYFNQVRNLERQIDVASEARDRLLPKLMSGEIEV